MKIGRYHINDHPQAIETFNRACSRLCLIREDQMHPTTQYGVARVCVVVMDVNRENDAYLEGVRDTVNALCKE